MSTDGTLRVAALNLRVGGAPRAGAIADLLHAQDADVVALGEAYPAGHPQAVLDALAERGFVHRATADGDLPRYPLGVALASRRPLDGVRQPLAGPERHRLLEAVVDGVVVAAAYFPPGLAGVGFWRRGFLPYAGGRIGDPAVLLGDWNTGTPRVDEAGASLPAAREFAALAEQGWVDAWRSRNPDAREYTWFSAKPHVNGFRVDHAFLSPSLAPRLLGARYDHSARETGVSDHSALVVDLAAAPQ